MPARVDEVLERDGAASTSVYDLGVPPPMTRGVARAVANLGNTCYMNAVLQALAHAPELCMAIDVEGHRRHCPVYQESLVNRPISAATSRSSSPDYNAPVQQRVVLSSSLGIRKSRRTRSPTSLASNANNSGPPSLLTAGSNGTDVDDVGGGDGDISGKKFCALCEFENHVYRVFPRNCNSSRINYNTSSGVVPCPAPGGSGTTIQRDKPVAPTDFVNGFIQYVAPWFKLGQQEDSHEFLRILVDSMQKSCKHARDHAKAEQLLNNSYVSSSSPSRVPVIDQGNPQDTPTEDLPQEGEDDDDVNVNGTADQGRTSSGEGSPEDSEYPFQLFRGMVESKVTCGFCYSTSSTLDPIEDLGLDVTPFSSSSASSSPTTQSGHLADVPHALQRFARAEALDSGYKCENCGKLGRATKQSRLASIPPILTLHLKRFRYGSTDPSSTLGLASSTSSTMAPAPTTRRSQRSSEVSQLMSGSNTSGSAKIEGPSAFKTVMDLKPYLTETLQAQHSNMLCRLFAVIVHVGKNSHSGHYLAYVRNIGKNEWWKMDDSRVTLASMQEVMNAEAYMLFYRVVDHPYSKELASKVKLFTELHDKEQKETYAFAVAATHATAATAFSDELPMTTAPNESDEPIAWKSNVGNTKVRGGVSTLPTTRTTETTTSAGGGGGPASSVKNNPRKRKAPDFTCGEDWARSRTTISDRIIAGLRDIEAQVSDYIRFTPAFFKLLEEQACKQNAKIGHGPSSGICCK
jgi:ubiquitin C-terminal hydrolase